MFIIRCVISESRCKGKPRFSDWGTLKNPIIIGFKKTSETSINKGKNYFCIKKSD